MKDAKKRRLRGVKGLVTSFLFLTVIYLGVSFYFTNHFYLESSINSISLSGKTLEEAHDEILAQANSYVLELKGKNNIIDEIKGSEIDLKYSSEEKIKDIKKSQNPFAWITAIWRNDKYEDSEIVSYNEEKLKEKINSLKFLKDDIIKCKNATFDYSDNVYKITNEVLGNEINKNILSDKIVSSIIRGEKIVDLESEKCYIEPELKADSKEAIEIKDTLNKYVGSKITYNVQGTISLLESSTINKWLKVNEDNTVILDEGMVKAYITNLAKKFNTIGKPRQFKTSIGKTIVVSGGDYGTTVDVSDEVTELISLIKEGKTISREPEFVQSAIAKSENDIGKTYVEINLTKQHMWFYKDGSLVADGDVVTGNLNLKHDTPPGVYRLKYKQRDAILKGEGYESPVNFWMPFNGGIGIHDASWRGAFGGNIYKTNGSHGCVNSPYNLAKAIYDNITAGTAVVCYFE